MQIVQESNLSYKGWNLDVRLEQQSIFVAERRVELLSLGYEPSVLPLHHPAIYINLHKNTQTYIIVHLRGIEPRTSP